MIANLSEWLSQIQLSPGFVHDLNLYVRAHLIVELRPIAGLCQRFVSSEMSFFMYSLYKHFQ